MAVKERPTAGRHTYTTPDGINNLGGETLYERVDITSGDYIVTKLLPDKHHKNGSRVIMATTPGIVVVDLIDRDGNTETALPLPVKDDRTAYNVIKVYGVAGGTTADGILLAN